MSKFKGTLSIGSLGHWVIGHWVIIIVFAFRFYLVGLSMSDMVKSTLD